jgi:hypothetical protein
VKFIGKKIKKIKMKKKILLCILLLVSNSIQSQKQVDIPYEYPVKPGSEKWGAFISGQQMLEACQIPQKVLNSLTTKALAETCMNYPLFFEYLTVNDEREGIKKMIEKFNGLRELSKRNDGTLELIKIYKAMPVLSKIPNPTSKEYHLPYKLPFIELLLSDDNFINQLNLKERTELKKIVLDRYENKLANPNVYSLYNISKTFLLGAVILDKQDEAISISTEERKTLKTYINNHVNATPELLTEISKLITTK